MHFPTKNPKIPIAKTTRKRKIRIYVLELSPISDVHFSHNMSFGIDLTFRKSKNESNSHTPFKSHFTPQSLKYSLS